MRFALLFLVVLLGISSCRSPADQDMAQRVTVIDDALGLPPTSGQPRHPSRAARPVTTPESLRRGPSGEGNGQSIVDPATSSPSAIPAPSVRVAPLGFKVLVFEVEAEEHSVVVPEGYCNLFAGNRPLPARLTTRITGNSGGRFHPDMVAMPCADIYTAGLMGTPTSFIFFVRAADSGVPVDYFPETLNRHFFPRRFRPLIAASGQGPDHQKRAFGNFMQSVGFPSDIVSAHIRMDEFALTFAGKSRFQMRGEQRYFSLDATTFRHDGYFATIGVTTEVEAGREVVAPITSDRIRKSLRAE
ncbi:MAG: hypothetical protein P1U49_09100 [Minwuia sp.]|nr:hypothetical protein [Minwuia sp.]